MTINSGRKIKELLFYVQDSEVAFLLFFSTGIGLGAGFGAIVFRWLINNSKTIFFDRGHDLLQFMGPYCVILIPVIGGLIIGPIIHFFATETKGHGVPEVMLAVSTLKGRIRIRVAVIKALVSSICIGSGGSVGREGPIVQIGSALGSSLGQLFKLSQEKVKILVACGAASGVAATFNAPLAGIFFALEVILREYGPRHISSIILSAVTATVVSRHFLGDTPAFATPAYQLLSLWELPLYFVFGFLAALTALFFIRFLYKTEDLFDAWKFPEYLKPAVGGLLLGLIGLYFPQIFGVGYGAIELALDGHMALQVIIILVLIKIVATSITLGSGGSGGVFAPSLFIGAMLGGAYGKLTQLLVPDIAILPGACALVGMGAVFAGAANAPVSAILILFEMTGDYKIILPLMITCIISTVVVRRITKESIYTLKLRRRGIDIQKVRGIDLMEAIKVSEAMNKDVITINEAATASDARNKLRVINHRGLAVVDDENNLIGMLTRKDIIYKAFVDNKRDIPVKEIMTEDLIVCYPDENLRTALEKLGERNIGRIPVVERDKHTHLLGLITRKNIIAAYNKTLKEREEPVDKKG